MTTKEFDIALAQLMGQRYGTLLQEPDSAPVTTVVLEAMKTVHNFGVMFAKHAAARRKKRRLAQERAAKKEQGA